jgi:teichuronic acid exporter
MNLSESIRHGAKWVLAGNTASQVLQFGFGIILARLLVPADFGTLVTVQIFTGLAGFVSGGGMGQALVRAKEAKHEDFQVVFTIQILLGLLVYASFFLAAPLLARWYSTPLYADLLRVTAISFLLRPFFNMPNAWLSREMLFKRRAIIDLISVTLGSVVSVVLARLHFGVWSLVFGGIAGTILSIFTLMIVTPIRPRVRFNAALAKELGLYGLKVTTNDFVSYIRGQTPNFFLSFLQGPAIVGLFNKADSLAKVPRVVAGSVYDPVFRSLAKAQDNEDRSHYIYFRTVTLLSVYMLPLFIGLAWLARPLIALLYGDNWLPSAAPLAILSIVGLFACVGFPSGAVLAAQNWLGREVFVHLLQTALFAASCIIGLHWGLSGVAWGILASEGVSVLFIAFLVKRCLRSSFTKLVESLAPGLLLNALLCGTLLLADFVLPSGLSKLWPFLYILIMSALGAIVYLSAFLFVPIPALASESKLWRNKIRAILSYR